MFILRIPSLWEAFIFTLCHNLALYQTRYRARFTISNGSTSHPLSTVSLETDTLCCTQNQNLSERKSWSHFCIQFCCWVHHCRREFLCCTIQETAIMVTLRKVLVFAVVTAVSVLILVELQTSIHFDSKFVMQLQDSARLTSKHVCPLGRQWHESHEILHGIQYDPPTHQFHSPKTLDSEQCEYQCRGKIYHTLDIS